MFKRSAFILALLSTLSVYAVDQKPKAPLGLKTIKDLSELKTWSKLQKDNVINESIARILGLGNSTPSDFIFYNIFDDIELNGEKVKKVLSLNGSRNLRNAENYLSFDYNDMGGIINNYGYCHGYSYTSSVLRHLLHYDPQNFYSSKLPLNREERLLVIFKLIEKAIYEMKPVVIPGYRSLYHLSSDEDVKSFLRIIVAQFWAKKNSYLFDSGRLLLMAQNRMDSNIDHEKMVKSLEVNFWPIIGEVHPDSRRDFFQPYIHVKPLVGIQGKHYSLLETYSRFYAPLVPNEGYAVLHWFSYNDHLGGKITSELRKFYNSKPELGIDLEQNGILDSFEMPLPPPYLGTTRKIPNFLEKWNFTTSLGEQP